MGDLDRLIEVGYDAVAGATPWPQFLQVLKQGLGADHTGITATSMVSRAVSLVTYAEPDAYWEAQYASRFAPIGPVSPEAVVRIPVGWSGPIDFPREFYRTEFYNEFMAPQRMHHVVLGLVKLRSADGFVVLSSNRSPHHKPLQGRAIELHSRIVRHLGWAFHLRERLQRANAGQPRVWSAWEESLQPVAMLDSHGRVAYLNPAAVQVLAGPHGLRVRGYRLTAQRSDENQRLQKLVRNALQVFRMPVPEGDRLVLKNSVGVPTLTLHIHPLNVGREEIALGGPRLSAIVFLTPIARPKPISVDELRTRFGLTGAEAHLAKALEKTEGLKEVAASLGITYETARTRLQTVFHKTGTRRQSALIRLMLETRE